MNFVKEPKWSDLVSPTMTPEEYLKIFGDKVKKVYKNYKPKSNVIEKARNLLKNKKEKLKVVALGAEWCPDCNRNVPSMIKIVEDIKSENIEFCILYGIMVEGLHKSGRKIWHKTRSPPEATDPKFDLKAIPTFYFFNNSGEYLDVIVENPGYQSTLEEDILKILEKNL